MCFREDSLAAVRCIETKPLALGAISLQPPIVHNFVICHTLRKVKE
jgi:hypothetical protein